MSEGKKNQTQIDANAVNSIEKSPSVFIDLCSSIKKTHTWKYTQSTVKICNCHRSCMKLVFSTNPSGHTNFSQH